MVDGRLFKFLRTWRCLCIEGPGYDLGLVSYPSMSLPRALYAIEEKDRGTAIPGPCRAHAHQNTVRSSTHSHWHRYGRQSENMLAPCGTVTIRLTFFGRLRISSVFVLTSENETPLKLGLYESVSGII